MPVEKTKKFIAKILHYLFELGIALKSLNGIIETILGTLILLTSTGIISRKLLHMSRLEMLTDPHDKFARSCIFFFQHFSTNTRIFMGIYILLHGLVNLFIGYLLFREKIWAYKATIITMSVLLVYQIYRIIEHHSPLLMILTVVDIFFIYLTWRESQLHKNKPVVI